jgi:hypothetical protein
MWYFSGAPTAVVEGVVLSCLIITIWLPKSQPDCDWFGWSLCKGNRERERGGGEVGGPVD